MADQDLQGFDDLATRLVMMGEGAAPALAAGLYERGEAIMADSKENYVPVDEGVLKGTGYVKAPEFKGNEVSVTLGYGGPAESYAIRVHEDPTSELNRQLDRQLGASRVGQWKYLETPVAQQAATMPADLSDSVERAFRRLAK